MGFSLRTARWSDDEDEPVSKPLCANCNDTICGESRVPAAHSLLLTGCGTQRSSSPPPIVPILSALCPIRDGGRTLSAHAARTAKRVKGRRRWCSDGQTDGGHSCVLNAGLDLSAVRVCSSGCGATVCEVHLARSDATVCAPRSIGWSVGVQMISLCQSDANVWARACAHAYTQ